MGLNRYRVTCQSRVWLFDPEPGNRFCRSADLRPTLDASDREQIFLRAAETGKRQVTHSSKEIRSSPILTLTLELSGFIWMNLGVFDACDAQNFKVLQLPE